MTDENLLPIQATVRHMGIPYLDILIFLSILQVTFNCSQYHVIVVEITCSTWPSVISNDGVKFKVGLKIKLVRGLN